MRHTSLFPRRRQALAVLAAASLHLASAQAADTWLSGGTGSVLLRAGTLGAGPELDMRIAHSPFGVRVDVDGLGFGDSDIVDCRFSHAETAYGFDAGVRLGGTVRLLNGGLTADYYPFGRGFRLSAGVVLNGNRVTASGGMTGALRVGTTSMSGALPGRVEASASFNLAAPIIGFGYSALVTRHLRLSVDLGAMYEGDPHLAFALSDFPMLPAVADSAERERERLQHELDEPFYPVAMLGIGWQF